MPRNPHIPNCHFASRQHGKLACQKEEKGRECGRHIMFSRGSSLSTLCNNTRPVVQRLAGGDGAAVFFRRVQGRIGLAGTRPDGSWFAYQIGTEYTRPWSTLDL